MGDFTLEDLHAGNISAANSLTLKPGQERFLQPESYQHAAATVDPGATWQRVVVEDGTVVGYIIGHFDAGHERPEFRSALWQINVAAAAQGRGVGRFAAEALAAEAAKRGFDHVDVIWEAGEAGPEAFFLKIGFSPVGETPYGEVIGELSL